MVTNMFKGVKHYWLNGEWFHSKEAFIEKNKTDVFEGEKSNWVRGTVDNIIGSGECRAYENLILDMCVLYEKLKTMRPIIDCKELWLATNTMQQTIIWMEQVMGKYAPPAIENK